ncbi:hypothetical protein ES708_19794 [subsurface metagenome]
MRTWQDPPDPVSQGLYLIHLVLSYLIHLIHPMYSIHPITELSGQPEG